MPSVVPVRFAYATRDLWFDAAGLDIAEADHVICATERGTEIGLATADAREVPREQLRSLTGDATLKPVHRIATDEDLELADELAERGAQALPVFRRLVTESGLDMKPVGVEYLFGGEKVICYFSAEERVDFRQLVRQLSNELHERIDMRQIGVREEAAHVGGFAHCGQELCCARFGHQFEPVSIRMAKEQDLPLNSTKISGACGRLMCCLRYEFEAYRDFKSRAPKRNAVIDTPLGKAKIVEYDTPKEQVALRLENGKQVRVALADMVASEAAVKKSEELHCPCRPDTVTREALERLASPEVQMALAELDREAGIVDASYDSSDIFVEPKSKSRRRRARSRQGEDGAEASQPKHAADPAAGAAGEGNRTRRRRRKHGAEGEQDAQGQLAAGSMGAEAAGGGAEEAASAGAKRSRRRRRHHGAADAVADGADTQQRQAEARGDAAKQGADQAPKPRQRRRRPGDHGGAETAAAKPATGRRPGDRGGAQASARKPGDQGGAVATGTRRPGDHGGAQAAGAAGDAAATGEAKPKRRRRRRGGRGKGGSGGAEGGAPSSQG